MNSVELADLLAHSATDTCSLAGVLSGSALVLVHAVNPDAHAFALAFLSQLDDESRASLHASAASHALLVVNLWKSGLRVHVYSVELTSGNAVATAETSESAGSLAGAA